MICTPALPTRVLYSSSLVADLYEMTASINCVPDKSFSSSASDQTMGVSGTDGNSAMYVAQFDLYKPLFRFNRLQSPHILKGLFPAASFLLSLC